MFKEFPSNSIFCDKVYVFFCFDDFVELDYVGVPHLSHDFDFPVESILVCFIGDFIFLYDLEDYLLVSKLVLGNFDFAEGAYSDLLAQKEIIDHLGFDGRILHLYFGTHI